VLADPRRIERAPLAAGTQYEKNSVHRRAITYARVVATKWMWFPRWKQRLHFRPQFVWNSPTIVFVDQSHTFEKIKGHSDKQIFGADIF
jgi:hypothetical protein